MPERGRGKLYPLCPAYKPGQHSTPGIFVTSAIVVWGADGELGPGPPGSCVKVARSQGQSDHFAKLRSPDDGRSEAD